jgi:short-chain fatty acids transporter
LVASAYAGFVLWHMGYSSSAGLFVATEGHSLQGQIGILPITETIFTWQNALVAGLGLIVITVLCPLMKPRDEDIITVDPELLRYSEPDEPAPLINEQATPAQRLDNTSLFNRVLGVALLSYIAFSYAQKGFFLTLDIVNWSFLGLGLLLARSLLHYVRLINNAGAVVGAILIQYPFYAGILGMMSDTGLVEMLSQAFVSIASKETLSLYAFLSAGVVNMFIPSGGAQWVIQGPIFIDAAQTLGVAPAEIVLAVAYGDQWTNMIQPFWTIPLLAIAGLHMRQIMGYAFIIFIATMLVFAGGLYFLGPTL